MHACATAATGAMKGICLEVEEIDAGETCKKEIMLSDKEDKKRDSG